jgi:hypothetical protein
VLVVRSMMRVMGMMMMNALGGLVMRAGNAGSEHHSSGSKCDSQSGLHN